MASNAKGIGWSHLRDHHGGTIMEFPWNRGITFTDNFRSVKGSIVHKKIFVIIYLREKRFKHKMIMNEFLSNFT